MGQDSSNRRAGLKLRPWFALAVLLLFGIAFESRAAGPSPRFVGPPSDPWIPNFAHPDVAGGPLVPSVQLGAWADPGTWGGAVPTASDVAVVRHALSITTATAHDIVIEAGGSLVFRTDVDTHLEVGTLQVHSGGTLEIGTQASPIANDVTAEIVFVDRPIDTAVDPGQYGNGLLVLGTLRIHGAPKSDAFVRLGAEPFAGINTLTLSRPVTGWKTGDRLVVPDSRHVDPRSSNGFVSQTELIVLGDSNHTATVRSIDALAFTHPGARDVDSNLDFLPHVGNLSRNVVLRSENPSGNRGHVQCLHRSDVDVRYALFEGLGRTTALELDNAAFDEAGNATHIGTNQAGRYALHAHFLLGPPLAQASGRQYSFIGNVIDGGLGEHAFKWGIAVHASHYGTVAENVIYNYAGSSVVTEDGSESHNLFERNLALRSSSYGALDTHDRGTAGTAFWFRGPNNRIRNNVAADVRTSGFSLNAYRLGNETHAIPSEQGADADQVTNMNTLPILEMTDNEAYGPMFFGLDLWEIGSTGEHLHQTEPSLVSGFSAWHFWSRGAFFYRSHRLMFKDLVMRGDAAWLSNRFVNPIGLSLQSLYRLRNISVVGADIQGLRTGISVDLPGLPADMIGDVFSQPSPQDRTSEVVIQDSYLRNYFDLSVTTRRNLGSPRRTALCNVDFDTVDVGVVDGEPERSITRSYSFGLDRNVVSQDQVVVFNHDDTSADFELFFTEQAADFIAPQTSADGRRVGSSIAGLTNQENWDQLGIAIAGQVAPCLDTTTHPDARGFTCALDAASGLLDVSAPTTPLALLNSGSPTCDAIQLAWLAACDDVGVAGYRVWRDGVEIATTLGSTFVDSTAVPNVNHTYSVAAYDAAGNVSERSNPIVRQVGAAGQDTIFCDAFESGSTDGWSGS